MLCRDITAAMNVSVTLLSDSDLVTGSTVNGSGRGQSEGRIRNERLAAVEIAVQLVILCAAVIGNVLVLVVVLSLVRRRRGHGGGGGGGDGAAAAMPCPAGRHTTTLGFTSTTQRLSRMNRMIVHLSTADLFVAFFNVLPQLLWDVTGTFRGNDLLCRTVTYLQLVAMYASSYVLVATAVDRYLAICRPFNALRRRGSDRLVGAAWLLALVFAVPQLAVFGYREADDSGYDDCWAVFDPAWSLRVYITWTTLAIYVCPAIILAVSYIRICCAVIRSIRQRQLPAADTSTPPTLRCHGNVTSSSSMSRSSVPARSTSSSVARSGTGARLTPSPTLSHAKIRTIKLTITVNVSYVVCWGPFFISHVWAAYDSSAPFQGRLHRLVFSDTIKL